MNIESLKKLGSEWQKNNYHRIYFNDLPKWYGLECSYYGTGNISSASLDGEKISNSQAKKIISKLTGKLWFDIPSEKWQWQYISDSDAKTLINIIENSTNGEE